MLPTIAVVIPSMNQGRFLTEALESVFAQGYPKLEVIVMDGGSDDASPFIIQSYADRLAYWQSATDGGHAAAINAGVRHSTSTLVAWLNADDYYLGDALWVVGRAYAAHPDHGLYLGNGLRHDQRQERLTPFCRHHLALNRDALRFGLDYILQPATFFLRAAWEEVGGVDESLRFCLDWDLLSRVADRHPAVLINEFLAASREHDATKTRTGGMQRAEEIRRWVEARSGQALTPGSVYYLLEAMIDRAQSEEDGPLRAHLWDGMRSVQRTFQARWGNLDGFPEAADPQDHVFLTIARPAEPRRPRAHPTGTPSIGLVVPSFNHGRFLRHALDSALSQEYPRLELSVMDGGSSDGTASILSEYADRLWRCRSHPDGGAADAINQGLALSRGEILGWLGADDALATDALWHVAEAFARDPDLDMVFGNAVFIDEHDHVHIADHGWHRTGLYYGEPQTWDRIPYYWTYIHAIPQPTVFFRRRLLERCGMLDEQYRFIYDFELFWRFTRVARVAKLERTLAFYRIHSASKTGGGWRPFQVELYRFSRPRWPRCPTRRFYHTWRDFVGCYMRHRYYGKPRRLRYWAIASAVAAAALFRLGNPESWTLPLGET